MMVSLKLPSGSIFISGSSEIKSIGLYTCNNGTGYCSKSNEELKGYQYVSPPTRFVSICSMHSHKLVACKRYRIHCDYNILMTVITISAGAPLDSSPNSGKDSGNQFFAIKVVLVSPWFALFFWSWAKTLTKPARTSILSTSFGPANEDTKTKWPKAFLFLQIVLWRQAATYLEH